MSIQNLVVNGSFENGALPPWVGQNATVTTQFSHSGFWSARLLGGAVTSFIAQFVPVDAGEGLEFLVSLAKEGFPAATGPTGATGATGATGPTGATGAT
ncbi:NTTRR-F1 domain, partial [Bacillus paralicheniformis]|uniref:NTTRR-F1 domain n=1 Tax=Bacillus paralicheniformis TaxID=1648923 RepID=UPI0021CEF91B